MSIFRWINKCHQSCTWFSSHESHFMLLLLFFSLTFFSLFINVYLPAYWSHQFSLTLSLTSPFTHLSVRYFFILPLSVIFGNDNNNTSIRNFHQSAGWKKIIDKIVQRTKKMNLHAEWIKNAYNLCVIIRYYWSYFTYPHSLSLSPLADHAYGLAGWLTRSFTLLPVTDYMKRNIQKAAKLYTTLGTYCMYVRILVPSKHMMHWLRSFID